MNIDVQLCNSCGGPVSPTKNTCTRCGREAPLKLPTLPPLPALAQAINPIPRSGPTFRCEKCDQLVGAEALSVLPDGKTIHVGCKGRNLPGMSFTLPTLPPFTFAPLPPAPWASATPSQIIADKPRLAKPTLSLPPLPPLGDFPSTSVPRALQDERTAAYATYLGAQPCRVLVADSPWTFGDKLPGGGRGAEKHYDVLTVEQIKNFPLPPIADNCVLFMWRVAAMVPEAYAVVESWGFKFKSEITWRKVRTCKECKGNGWRGLNVIVPGATRATGPSQIDVQVWCEPCKGRGTIVLAGMGRYTRHATESCIIAIRDSGLKMSAFHPEAKDVVDIFDAPREEHSKKPDKFYELVERMYPNCVRTELFARRQREGWQCYGNELEGA